MTLPTRQEADAILATQPWARVCKELSLYVAELPGSCTPERATAAALDAVARARVELWSFRERPLWMFLTDLVRGESTSPEGRAAAMAAVARIPMLSNDELDRELRRRGIDPEELTALGARIKKEAILRAPPRATAKQPAPRAPAPRQDQHRRPELPTLSRAQWAALSMVVLLTAALALLGAFAASRSL